MIHILNATGRLSPYKDQITKIIDDTLHMYNRISPVGPVDIVVAENPAMTIPDQGMGGYASTAHELYIPIDLDAGDPVKIIDTHLASTIAHELSHIVRMQANIPFASSGNLADNVIGEGIADHMSISMYPNQDTPWTKALSTKVEFEKTKNKFLEESYEQHYDHNAWFYGSDTNNIPQWAGYSLGYTIVDNYLKKTNKKIHEILVIPTDEVLGTWK